jgi:hypothetical protein
LFLEKPFTINSTILHGFNAKIIISNKTFIYGNHNIIKTQYVIKNWDNIKDETWNMTQVPNINTINGYPCLFMRIPKK